MPEINGKSAAQVLNDFSKLFAQKKDGSFKTGVDKTTGFIYADKTGVLKSATGFRASTKAGAGDQAANRQMRIELLQAFADCHATRAFLNVAREELGLNPDGGIDQGNQEACGKPLSRRTVKRLIMAIRSGTYSNADKSLHLDNKALGLESLSDKNTGWEDVTVNGAQDAFLNAYRQLPEDVDGLLKAEHEDRYDDAELKSMKEILFSAFPKPKLDVVMTEPNELGQLPAARLNEIAYKQKAVAHKLGLVANHFYGHAQGVNPHLARLLISDSFRLGCGTAGKLAIASHLLDEIEKEDPSAFKGKDPMKALYDKLCFLTNVQPKNDPACWPPETAQMITKLYNDNHNTYSGWEDGFAEAARQIIKDVDTNIEENNLPVRQSVMAFLQTVLRDSVETLPLQLKPGNLAKELKSVSPHAKRVGIVLMKLLSREGAAAAVALLYGSKKGAAALVKPFQSILDDPRVARVLSTKGDQKDFDQNVENLLTDTDLTAKVNGLLTAEKNRLEDEERRLAEQQTAAEVKRHIKDTFSKEPVISDMVENAAWAEDVRYDKEVSQVLVTQLEYLIGLRDSGKIRETTFANAVRWSVLEIKSVRKNQQIFSDLVAIAEKIDLSELLEAHKTGDSVNWEEFAFDLGREILGTAYKNDRSWYFRDADNSAASLNFVLQVMADSSEGPFRKILEALRQKDPGKGHSLAASYYYSLQENSDKYKIMPDQQVKNGTVLKAANCAGAAIRFFEIIMGTKGLNLYV